MAGAALIWRASSRTRVAPGLGRRKQLRLFGHLCSVSSLHVFPPARRLQNTLRALEVNCPKKEGQAEAASARMRSDN